MDRNTRSKLIRYYFIRGYTYQEIQTTLCVNHDYCVSLVHLKRIISGLGLFRKQHHSPLEDVVDFIMEEVDNNTGQQCGYRFMHSKCIKAGLRVTQQIVLEALRIIDPEGVALRKRRRLIRRRYYAKGPNDVWHIDSWDKLKPYGIGINACIDGFSRKILWAEAYHTNSDPSVIATWYLNAVESLRGCSQKIRVDAGTENVTMIRMHKFFTDNDDSAIIGTSTLNTRIESWWGQYRRANSEFFIAMFHELQATGDYTGDAIDKELVRFCFLTVIQVSVRIGSDMGLCDS